MNFSKMLIYVLGSIVAIGLVYWGAQYLPDKTAVVVVANEEVIELPMKKPVVVEEKKSWYNPMGWF